MTNAKLEGVPAVEDLVKELAQIRDSLKIWGLEDTDVRLRVHNGDWYVYSGSSDYDQDHRGHWGSSSIEATESNKSLEGTASYLIDEVEDDYAMSYSEVG